MSSFKTLLYMYTYTNLIQLDTSSASKAYEN